MKRQLIVSIAFIVLGTYACLAGEAAVTATDEGAVAARTKFRAPPPGNKGDGGDQPSGIGAAAGRVKICFGTGDGCDQPRGIPAAVGSQ